VRREYVALQKEVDDLDIIDCTDPAGKMLSPSSVSELLIKKIGEL
jgi:hypothetical protein